MKLRIHRSGGIINLELNGELTIDALPDGLRQRTQRALTEGVFEGNGGDGPMPDAQTYELDLLGSDGVSKRRLHFDDASISPEAADLIDELLEFL